MVQQFSSIERVHFPISEVLPEKHLGRDHWLDSIYDTARTQFSLLPDCLLSRSRWRETTIDQVLGVGRQTIVSNVRPFDLPRTTSQFAFDSKFVEEVRNAILVFEEPIDVGLS